MKSNLVRVDFRKNDKSEKAQDNHGFRFNQQKLFEGEVTIFQTKKSGDFWGKVNMRIEGKTNVEIGAMFLFEDAQKVLKDADLKNKCNVVAYRWIKKAEANINAVEKGMFGVGH